MYLINHLTSGLLMQTVYVLGYDCFKLACFLQRRQIFMGIVGLYVAGIHLLPVKLVIDLWLVNKTAVTQ